MILFFCSKCGKPQGIEPLKVEEPKPIEKSALVKEVEDESFGFEEDFEQVTAPTAPVAVVPANTSYNSESKPNNGLAIAGFVLGLVSLSCVTGTSFSIFSSELNSAFASLIYIMGILGTILAIPGLVLSIIGVKKSSLGRLAIAGIVANAISIAYVIFSITIYFGLSVLILSFFAALFGV